LSNQRLNTGPNANRSWKESTMATRRRRLLQMAAMAAMLAAPALSAPGARAAGEIDCADFPPLPATPSAAAPAGTPAAAPAAPFPEGGGELTVFAAASLTEAFERVAADLEAAHPGLDISYSFAGSQALVTQLREGARADVFASANEAQMSAARDNGNVTGPAPAFARNRLTVVVPAANPAGIASAGDLVKEGVKLVLAQPEVPAGKYARQAVCAMAADPAFGADFARRVAANVVSEEEDVRDVLAKVELGEADAGIVYVTDALAGGDQVSTAEIPAAFNPVASYPVAAVAGGDEALADAFIGYLLSEDGQATLATFGFAGAGE